jgi:hypothetical protein
MEVRVFVPILATEAVAAVIKVKTVESLITILIHRMPLTLLLFHDLQTVRTLEVMGASVATLAHVSHRPSPSADFLNGALFHHQHQALALTVAGAGRHCPTATETEAGMEGTIMRRAQLA